MRVIILLTLLMSLVYSREWGYEFRQRHLIRDTYISENGQPAMPSMRSTNNTRNDTTTIWFNDLEGDILSEGWVLDSGWVKTEDQNWSPTHSLNFDDDFSDGYQMVVSPLIDLPNVEANELLKYTFAVRADLPDFDGDGDNYLEDYYFSLIGDSSDAVPQPHFHPSDNGAYEGNSWWCADESIGGYDNEWIQYLDTPPVSIPSDQFILKAQMQWSIESPLTASGAVDDYPCLDGWDAANVRISIDGGTSWSLLTATSAADSYHFDYGYGWIWNDEDYACDEPLSNLSAGWASTQTSSTAPVEDVDWHEVTFDLSNYSGEEVIVRFAFGSDPGLSTADGDPVDGFRVDNIEIVEISGGFDPIFFDDADNEIHMIPGYEETETGLDLYYGFYDYGDVTRPGSSEWEIYEPGDAFNNNVQMDLTAWAGESIHMVFIARTDDNNDTGEDGSGLFIDDIHIWKVEVIDIPQPMNLQAEAEDNSITVAWEAPPGGSYDNAGITYNDGNFESGVSMTQGTAVMGTLFSMPYGVDSVIVHSVEVFGGGGGNSRITGYSVTLGMPDDIPTNSVAITTTVDTWAETNLNWGFSGSFMIGVEIDTSVAISIDTDNAPSSHSYAYFGGWEPWSEFVAGTTLDDGEFGIRATVSTIGEGLTPTFNVYRSVSGSDFNLLFNSSGLTDTEFTDNFNIQYGTEYCYKVSAIYDGEEGNLVGPVCITPETNTTYEIFHDDGTAEGSTSGFFQTGNRFAVKFTPTNYPVRVYSANVYRQSETYGTAKLIVYSDNNGQPDSLLKQLLNVNLSPGWSEISMFDYGIDIEDGSFYIAIEDVFTSSSIGIDTDNSANDSYAYYGSSTGWESFGLSAPGALMIRAEVDSAAHLNLDEKLDNVIPLSFDLKQNYPNPFNPITTIEFSMSEASRARLSIFDMLGREVKILVDDNLMAGNYKYSLHGGDLTSGLYFYQLNVFGNGTMVYSGKRKLVLLK